MHATAAALIEAQPLLQALPASVRERLAAQPVHDLAPGTRVFERNAACGGFPLILSGCVRVFRHLANGRRIELYRVTPTQPCILSLGCLLGGSAYPASGVTSGHTRMLVMPTDVFNTCVGENAAFRTSMFRVLGERLVHTMELVEEIATLQLDIRLAAALLQHADALSDPALHIRITHQELADELGTVREMISRLLDDFEQRGMVELGRARLRVTNRTALQALASVR